MNWKIKNLMAMSSNDLENVVTSVSFEVNKSIDENEVSYSSIVFVTLGESFTPFADLTEEQVIGWVKESLGENQVASIEESLDSQLESIINPPVSPELVPLPWA
jgi:hypothetical protein